MELNEADIINPLNVLENWMKEVKRIGKQPNPNCFSIATTDQNGSSNSRMVLCKELNIVDGYIVFYTNYNSNKAKEIEHNPVCSGIFHWDSFGYQIRIKGHALKSSVNESDNYFSTRSLGSQAAAWASEQSNIISDRENLEKQFDSILKKFNIKRNELSTSKKKLPRPEFWGGYRIYINQVEIWLNQNDRFHDRLVFQRDFSFQDDKYISNNDWIKSRLQP